MPHGEIYGKPFAKLVKSADSLFFTISLALRFSWVAELNSLFLSSSTSCV